jgi:hypothetical protein
MHILLPFDRSFDEASGGAAATFKALSEMSGGSAPMQSEEENFREPGLLQT